jgi:hypothetical protein
MTISHNSDDFMNFLNKIQLNIEEVKLNIEERKIDEKTQEVVSNIIKDFSKLKESADQSQEESLKNLTNKIGELKRSSGELAATVFWERMSNEMRDCSSCFSTKKIKELSKIQSICHTMQESLAELASSSNASTASLSDRISQVVESDQNEKLQAGIEDQTLHESINSIQSKIKWVEQEIRNRAITEKTQDVIASIIEDFFSLKKMKDSGKQETLEDLKNKIVKLKKSSNELATEVFWERMNNDEMGFESKITADEENRKLIKRIDSIQTAIEDRTIHESIREKSNVDSKVVSNASEHQEIIAKKKLDVLQKVTNDVLTEITNSISDQSKADAVRGKLIGLQQSSENIESETFSILRNETKLRFFSNRFGFKREKKKKLQEICSICHAINKSLNSELKMLDSKFPEPEAKTPDGLTNRITLVLEKMQKCDFNQSIAHSVTLIMQDFSHVYGEKDDIEKQKFMLLQLKMRALKSSLDGVRLSIIPLKNRKNFWRLKEQLQKIRNFLQSAEVFGALTEQASLEPKTLESCACQLSRGELISKEDVRKRLDLFFSYERECSLSPSKRSKEQEKAIEHCLTYLPENLRFSVLCKSGSEGFEQVLGVITDAAKDPKKRISLTMYKDIARLFSNHRIKTQGDLHRVAGLFNLLQEERKRNWRNAFSFRKVVLSHMLQKFILLDHPVPAVPAEKSESDLGSSVKVFFTYENGYSKKANTQDDNASAGSADSVPGGVKFQEWQKTLLSMRSKVKPNFLGNLKKIPELGYPHSAEEQKIMVFFRNEEDLPHYQDFSGEACSLHEGDLPHYQDFSGEACSLHEGDLPHYQDFSVEACSLPRFDLKMEKDLAVPEKKGDKNTCFHKELSCNKKKAALFGIGPPGEVSFQELLEGKLTSLDTELPEEEMRKKLQDIFLEVESNLPVHLRNQMSFSLVINGVVWCYGSSRAPVHIVRKKGTFARITPGEGSSLTKTVMQKGDKLIFLSNEIIKLFPIELCLKSITSLNILACHVEVFMKQALLMALRKSEDLKSLNAMAAMSFEYKGKK